MTNHNAFTIIPIGIARSPYTQKFGIPRQSGLVPAAKTVIELNPSFSKDAVRGLEEFDYIWVQFIFHATLAEGYSELVRPPRLGGKVKKGVFATRAPHRPNGIGLSLFKLESIEYTQSIVKLHISGSDLLDKTPIIDIKPYLPHLESKPAARGGFTENRFNQLTVSWSPESLKHCPSAEMKIMIEQSLSQDPRPAHQHQLDKIFVMEIEGYEVRFVVEADTVSVLAIHSLNKV